jgi:hypothetical protein
MKCGEKYFNLLKLGSCLSCFLKCGFPKLVQLATPDVESAQLEIIEDKVTRHILPNTCIELDLNKEV